MGQNYTTRGPQVLVSVSIYKGLRHFGVTLFLTATPPHRPFPHKSSHKKNEAALVFPGHPKETSRDFSVFGGLGAREV